MEHRAQARLVAYGGSNPFDTFGRIVPLAPGEAQGRLNAAGGASAGWICRRLVGQHDDGPSSVTDSGEQPRRLDRGVHARFIRTGIGQTCRDKRADHSEAPPVQPLPQYRRLGGHETPVAELGTGVSACGDLVEHLFITRTDTLRLELQHAPRAGRIGDSDQAGLLISSQHEDVARDSHKCVRSAARARW